jgi:hypothetical protein
MFNEKIRIYDRVEFSGQSVVALLVLRYLKNFACAGVRYAPRFGESAAPSSLP